MCMKIILWSVVWYGATGVEILSAQCFSTATNQLVPDSNCDLVKPAPISRPCKRLRCRAVSVVCCNVFLFFDDPNCLQDDANIWWREIAYCHWLKKWFNGGETCKGIVCTGVVMSCRCWYCWVTILLDELCSHPTPLFFVFYRPSIGVFHFLACSSTIVGYNSIF